MLKVNVFNLGCKVNQYESENITCEFRKRGYQAECGLGHADIYIINSCAVTSEGEKKSRQAVARILKYNDNASIIVCGCASQNSPMQFSEYENVIWVIGVANKNKIVEVVEFFDKKQVFLIKDIRLRKKTCQEMIELFDSALIVESHDKACLPKCYENFDSYSEGDKTRAYIKICDGCNNFCTYCLVPYLRGRSRSRSIDDIIKEFCFLAKNYKEIVLIGIDISSYGMDIGESLVELIRQIKHSIVENGFSVRVRLGSIETSLIDDELLSEMKEGGYFCPHFHLSLQSGSNSVLKRMNRHYTKEEFISLTKRIRKHFPDSFIATDVIVGFPEETHYEFLETIGTINEIGFQDIHLFRYSRRKGTIAYDMKQIDGAIKQERLKTLEDIRLRAKTAYLKANIGKTVRVLFEEKKGKYILGHSDNFIKVYVEYNESMDNLNGLNKVFTQVELKETYNDGMKGVIK